LASETDFLDMYRTLGLRPGCELVALKQAYRRHVARLHPDRKMGAPVDPVAAERLQRLIAQYDAAMEFQREHGRLPGVTPKVRFVVPEASVQAVRLPAANRPVWHRPKWFWLVLVGVIIVLGWEVENQSPTSADAPAQAISAEQAPAPAPADSTPTLTRGMSIDEVRAIEGDPTSIHGDRWEYGPSWIRFEDDHVVEWHSSPLHSLEAPMRGSAAMPSSPSDH
jgi:hypothetical protein